MLKKILTIFSFFMLFFAFSLNAQVKSYFGGTLNIFGSSGTSPDYTIQGFFNDTSGEYPLDSIAVGDIIYVSEGATCVRLSVDTINSSAGGILNADVSDIDTILVSPPSGIGALMHETPNNSLPRYIPGLSETLLGCIRTHMTGKIDEGIVGGSTWLKPELEAGDVTIDANNNSLIIDSTSTTKITAVGTAQGDLVVSGSSSLPGSLSHIVGTDTSQFNISGSNGIDIITDATSGVNIDSPNGITINSNINVDKQDFRMYRDPNVDGSQYGYRTFVSPTLRNIYIGDILGNFNSTAIKIFDQTSTVEMNGSYSSGIKIVGDVTTIGDYLSDSDESKITLDVNGDVVFHSLNNFTFEGDGWSYNMAKSTPNANQIMYWPTPTTPAFTNLPTPDGNGIISALPTGDVSILASGSLKLNQLDSLIVDVATNVKFKMDSENQAILMGDYDNAGFGMQFTLSEFTGIAKLGDPNAIANGTAITVDDTNENITLNTNEGTIISGTGYSYNLAKTTPTVNQVMYWPTPTTPAFIDLPSGADGNGIISALPAGNVYIEPGTNSFELETTNGSDFYFDDTYFGAHVQTSSSNYGTIDVSPAAVSLYAQEDNNNYSRIYLEDDALQIYGSTAGSVWQYTLARETPPSDGEDYTMIWNNDASSFATLPISENGHSILDSLPFGNIRFGANGYQLRLDTAAFRIENPSSSFNFTSSTWSLRAGTFSNLATTFTGNDEEVKMTWLDAPNNHQNTISVSDVGIAFQGNVSGIQYAYQFPLVNPIASADSLRRVISWNGINDIGSFEVFNGGNYRTFNADGNILATDDYVEVDPNVTVHLPTPSSLWRGKRYVIIAGGGTSGGSPGTIDVVGGGSTIELGSSLTLDNAFESYALVCNGSIWIILNNKP